MLRACSIFAVLVLVSPFTGPVGAQPTASSHASAKEAARAAAASWLEEIDNGNFDDAWEAAASVFQARVSEDAWEEEGRRLRDSVQTGTNRTATMVKYRDALRQAEDGPVVILKYRSALGETIIQETVVTIRENTSWKVAGYQVTPHLSRNAHTLHPGGTD